MKFYINNEQYKVHLKDGVHKLLLYVRGIKLFSFDNLELVDSKGDTLSAKETRYYG